MLLAYGRGAELMRLAKCSLSDAEDQRQCIRQLRYLGFKTGISTRNSVCHLCAPPRNPV